MSLDILTARISSCTRLMRELGASAVVLSGLALSFLACDEIYFLRLTVEGGGKGRIESVPQALVCVQEEAGKAEECVENFSAGFEVELRAIQDDAEFVTWGGACSGGEPTCMLVVDGGDLQVTATFRELRFPVTILPEGDGSGSVRFESGASCSYDGVAAGGTCTEQLPKDVDTELIGVADAGTTIGWNGCFGDPVNDRCLVKVNEAIDIQVTFDRTVRTLTVTGAGDGNGSVSSTMGDIDCDIAGGMAEASSSMCTSDFAEGATVTLRATASGGSDFLEWTGACTGTDPTCVVTMDQDRQVTAEFDQTRPVLRILATGNGAGLVQSAPPGIDCQIDAGAGIPTTTCSAPFDVGAMVDLSPAPATGSFVNGWQDCDVVTGTTCTVTVNADRDVTVDFELTRVTLTVVPQGSGDGTVSTPGGEINCTWSSAVQSGTCDADFDFGTLVQVTATEAQGSSVGGWDIPACGAASVCDVDIKSDTVVTVTFDNVAQSTLDVRPPTSANGDGSVTSDIGGISCTFTGGTQRTGTCNAQYDLTESVTLTAVAQQGSQFTGWELDCLAAGAGPCTLSMSQSRQAAPIFLKLWTLTVDGAGTGGGTITRVGAGDISCTVLDAATTGDCDEPYVHGTIVTLTAAPDADSRLVSWSAPGCTAPADCTVTVNNDLTVTATFARQHTLTVLGDGDGDGSGVVTSASPTTAINCTITDGAAAPTGCAADFDEGAAVVLDATGSGASGFVDWQGCDQPDTPQPDQCTMNMTAPKSVTAMFATPVMRLSTDGVDMAATEGGANPRQRLVKVYNIGGGVIANLVATANPAAPWLTLTWQNGVNTADPTATLQVDGATAAEPLGTQTTTVTISGTGVTTQTFDVTLDVIRGVTQEAAADDIFMHAYSGITTPQTDVGNLPIRNGGRGVLQNLTVQGTSNSTFDNLTYAFNPGSTAPTVLEITAVCDIANRPCTAEVDWGNADFTKKIFLTFTFNAEPELRVEPQAVTLNGFAGGSSNVETVQLINENPQSPDGTVGNFRILNAGSLAAWLDVQLQNDVLTVTANPAAFGTLQLETPVADTVQLEADKIDTGGTVYDQSRSDLPVVLVLQTGIETSTDKVDIYAQSGAAPETIEVVLSNGSSLDLTGLVASGTTSWLGASLSSTSIAPATGSATPDPTVTLTLTADPSDPAVTTPGTYPATITIASATPGVPSVAIAVTLHVF